MNNLICPDSNPNLFGLFDTSIAPYLLYYAYIPIIFISIFLGLTIYRNAKNSQKPLENYLFLLLSVVFSVFLLSDIVQWIAAPVSIVHFGWQITPFLEFFILIITIYFVLVFLNKGNDIHINKKIILFLFSLPVLVFLPTQLNVESFNLSECEANISLLPDYVYVLKVFSVFFLAYVCLSKMSKTEDESYRKQIQLLMFASVSFLSIFAFSRIFGEITGFYEINLIGAFGMLVFFAFLTYMIVRFQAFNTKVFATEALVWTLTFLVGAQFFFIQIPINFLLNAVTFVSVIVLGRFLIRSVEREIEQKEYLKSLNEELRELIKQREGLVHLITHKVKGSFTRSKYIFSEMLVGTYGELSEDLKNIAKKGLDSDNEGIKTVDLVLGSVSLQQGKTRFEMKVFDFKNIVDEVIKDKTPFAQSRNLFLNSNISGDSFNVLGDSFWLKEAVNNLLENSIRYTREGGITIDLKKSSGKIVLCVKDTGVGLSEEDKKVLFTEGGRGKEALRLNTDSTGYGLYTVKLLADAHKGRVWAESEGEGKGSAFCIELPEV